MFGKPLKHNREAELKKPKTWGHQNGAGVNDKLAIKAG